MMDKSSFEITILPLYKRVYAMSLAFIGDKNEAADAVQETFAILWERREELERLESPEAYVRTVARNVCIRRQKELVKLGKLDEVSGVESSLLHSAELSSELDYLNSLIGSLPETQQKVMKLSVFGACTNEEITQLTGLTAENVRQLLSRARKKIKELYNNRNESL